MVEREGKKGLEGNGKRKKRDKERAGHGGGWVEKVWGKKTLKRMEKGTREWWGKTGTLGKQKEKGQKTGLR